MEFSSFFGKRWQKGRFVRYVIPEAILVSVTRARDYWHHFDDIVAGTLLGPLQKTLVPGDQLVDRSVLLEEWNIGR